MMNRKRIIGTLTVLVLAAVLTVAAGYGFDGYRQERLIAEPESLTVGSSIGTEVASVGSTSTAYAEEIVELEDLVIRLAEGTDDAETEPLISYAYTARRTGGSSGGSSSAGTYSTGTANTTVGTVTETASTQKEKLYASDGSRIYIVEYHEPGTDFDVLLEDYEPPIEHNICHNCGYQWIGSGWCPICTPELVGVPIETIPPIVCPECGISYNGWKGCPNPNCPAHRQD